MCQMSDCHFVDMNEGISYTNALLSGSGRPWKNFYDCVGRACSAGADTNPLRVGRGQGMMPPRLPLGIQGS